ncbi:YchO/YchP family invasin [Sodalis sp. RH21]|uniref:YchO/YchP family invasin n=1 Tax=unclassified Sodalis (in: enterobacteria) TaxID=2636512 RepID=UPI0039B6B95C
MVLLPLSAAALATDTLSANIPDAGVLAAETQSDLPTLGGESLNQSDAEQKLASLAKQLAEANNDASDLSWRTFLLEQAKGKILTQLQQQSEALLSPLGYSSVSLDVNSAGKFTGSYGQLLLPLRDTAHGALTYSQVGVQGTPQGAVGNVGLGQRWLTGGWQLGYNVFYDRYLQRDALRRGAIGAEARGDYLSLSSNYYYPLSAMRAGRGADTFLRQSAAGYDITTQGYLPFYRQVGASVKYERYYGDNVDLFDSGNYRNDPSALEFGVDYTPVPLMTLSARHKAGDSGETQDQYSLTVNYRLGVPFEQQISAQNVAEAHSLRGSRYDLVQRNNTPVLSFRQRKTLSVFLATPPWLLHSGDTVQLKVQVEARNKINAVSWQGDTHALSLTPPAHGNQPNGWSIIMPPWDAAPGATNAYSLSVTVEDDKQQRVTSNWIALKVEPPLTAQTAPIPY